MGINSVISHTLRKKHNSQKALKVDIHSYFALGVAFQVLCITLVLQIFLGTISGENNFSGRSCDNRFLLFQKMFPDSSIAKSFSMQRSKFAYTVNFGLALSFFF